MKIPNKFNGYSRDGIRLYNGPLAPLALAGTTAIGTGVGGAALAAGAGTALGTGLAAGTMLAGGGAGIAGLMGGLGGMGGAVAPGAFGALAPTVAAKLAPAAAAQAAGTIGTMAGSVAPGAFGANLAGAAAPGLTGTVGSVAPGAFGANLAGGASQGLASTLPGAANQTLASQYAAAQQQAALTKQNLLAQSGGTDVMGAATQRAATSPSYDLSAGFKQGLDPTRALQTPSLANPTAQAVNPADIVGRGIRPNQNFMQNLGNISSFQDVQDYAAEHPYATSAAAGLGAMGLSKMMQQKKIKPEESNAMIRPYTYERTQRPEAYAVSPTMDSSERMYFNDQYVAGEPYRADQKAEGGIAQAYAMGGPVEQMSAMNAIGANTGYPMASINSPMYSNPMVQRPEATNVIAPSVDTGVGAYSGEPRFNMGGPTSSNAFSTGHAMRTDAHGMGPSLGYVKGGASSSASPQYTFDPNTLQFTNTQTGKVSGGGGGGGIAALVTPVMPATPKAQPQQAAPINIPAYQSPEQQLGLEGFYEMMNQRVAGYGGYAAGGGVGSEPNLGGYSDGGRLLRGPGDGVSDSIPASIGDRQPARLADGEFVVPARIVSELGNGSTEAGARKLYAMMDRIQKGRRKSVGKGKVAVDSKASKHLPA